jgi:plasmid maintenance system antidote protein VapI
MPLKNPPHPGDFIRTELVEAAGLTVTAAAESVAYFAAHALQSAQRQRRSFR